MGKFLTVAEFEALVRERVKPMPPLMKKVKPKHVSEATKRKQRAASLAHWALRRQWDKAFAEKHPAFVG